MTKKPEATGAPKPSDAAQLAKRQQQTRAAALGKLPPPLEKK